MNAPNTFSMYWNQLVAGFPQVHVLQSWEWGHFKSAYGWKPLYLVWESTPGGVRLNQLEAGARPTGMAGPIGTHALPAKTKLRAAAQVLQRKSSVLGFPTPISVLYAPKGPLLDDWADAGLRQQVLRDLAGFAGRQGALFIKIDPDVCLGEGIPGSPDGREDHTGHAAARELEQLGWVFSQEQIQFKNSMLIDLGCSEDELLAAMKQKTRYNVRLSERKGVQVSPAAVEDLPALYRMYAETALRDGFAIREQGYYLALWQSFMQAGLAQPLVARVEGEPVAGVILFAFAGRSWFFYGMSRSLHRETMPNYLLQWEAIKWARAHGCSIYDLWGAPDEFSEADPMWGVYRFKDGLGARVVRRLGAWDMPVRPFLYRLYQIWLPRVLDWMRRRSAAAARGPSAGGADFGR